MEVFTLAACVALIVNLTSITKFLRARQIGDALTKVYVLGVGVVVAFLAASSNAMASIDVNGTPLGLLNGPSVILLGLSLASVGSFAYDYKKAVDGSDSAAEPPLAPALNANKQ